MNSTQSSVYKKDRPSSVLTWAATSAIVLIFTRFDSTSKSTGTCTVAVSYKRSQSLSLPAKMFSVDAVNVHANRASCCCCSRRTLRSTCPSNGWLSLGAVYCVVKCPRSKPLIPHLKQFLLSAIFSPFPERLSKDFANLLIITQFTHSHRWQQLDIRRRKNRFYRTPFFSRLCVKKTTPTEEKRGGYRLSKRVGYTAKGGTDATNETAGLEGRPSRTSSLGPSEISSPWRLG